MKTRNNNNKIILELARASYKSNKSRNMLMIGSITLTIVILFSIFSIMKGRIDAEYKMEVRHNGNTATTTLEFPTAGQIEAVRNLKYINNTGSVKHFADAYVDGHAGFACYYVDDDTYRKFYLPAYTDVQGTFPTEENEVMLAVRGLQEIGIDNPRIGMKIDASLVTGTGADSTRTLTLTGYYTEYVHPIEGPPIGYFAKKHLIGQGLDANVPTSLLIKQKDYMRGEKVEDMLYRDIVMKDKTQRFESYNSVNYNVIMRTIGGYDVAVTLILLIFSCVFFLNYNVMNIAITRDIRNLGLLKTIGTTNRQIRKIIYLQTIKMCIPGVLAGAGISILVVSLILPGLLSHYYMNNYGVSSQIIQFHPVLFLASMLCAVILAFISILRPACKAGKITPVQSVRFVEGSTLKRDAINSTKGSISVMAWRNILRNKKSNGITILSLFLGITTALASLLIVKGLDITNNFASFPDFEIDSTYNPLIENYDSSYVSLSKEDVDYIKSIEGMKGVSVIYGDYIRLDPEEKTWEPALFSHPSVRDHKTNEIIDSQLQRVRKNYYSTVIIADDNYLDKLEEYAVKSGISLDVEAVRSGECAFSTAGGFFSKQTLEESGQFIGKDVELMDVNKKKLGNIKFGGYVDTRKAAYPSDLHLMMNLPAPELIISESAFERLGLKKRPLNIKIYVEDEKEPHIKKQIVRFMDNKKKQLKPSEQDKKMPYLNINSEKLKAAADEISTMKTVMYTISILLTVLGLFNYLNATAVNLIGRKRELAVMESVGMTRRQLRRLLVTEGVYFSGIIGGLTATAGFGILIVLFKIIHGRMGYAKFIFPYMELCVIIFVIVLICIIVPLILYRKITDESIIDRLRE